MCSQEHFLFSCQSFRNLDTEAWFKKASESNVCMNCLRPGHTDKRCSLSHCKYCKCRHNTLLHRDQFSEEHPGDNIALSSNMIASSSNAHQDYVLLSTALAKMSDNTGRLHTVRLLLDNGSTSNFVTQDLCGKLGLLKRNTRSTVSGINDQISNTSESCNIYIHFLVVTTRT